MFESTTCNLRHPKTIRTVLPVLNLEILGQMSNLFLDCADVRLQIPVVALMQYIVELGLDASGQVPVLLHLCLQLSRHLVKGVLHVSELVSGSERDPVGQVTGGEFAGACLEPVERARDPVGPARPRAARRC